IDILTLFPEMFKGVLDTSILKKAQENDAFTYNLINFREYSTDKHQKVDDYLYGGGAGMVLTPEPIFDGVRAVTQEEKTKLMIILRCAQGETYNQQKGVQLATE